MTNFMNRLTNKAAKLRRKKQEKNTTVKGFTLVELIVVLVILAILAATLVPALTGYIDKANQKAAISECRSVVSAAQTLASEVYATKGAVGVADLDNEADVLELAEVKGTIEAITYDGGKVKTVNYTSSSGIDVVYDIDGEELYAIDGEELYAIDEGE